jgi:hypothetical protein
MNLKHQIKPGMTVRYRTASGTSTGVVVGISDSTLGAVIRVRHGDIINQVLERDVIEVYVEA